MNNHFKGLSYELMLPYGYPSNTLGTFFEHYAVDGKREKMIGAKYKNGRMDFYWTKYDPEYYVSILFGEKIGTAVEE